MSNMQVAIKKVLQDKRFKNRELQIMKMMDHANVVTLRNCFFTNEKNEVRLRANRASLCGTQPATALRHPLLCTSLFFVQRVRW